MMIEYINATEKDMREIAKVHRECFPEYFLTQLGLDLLEKYYLEFFLENKLFIIAREENKILGFCMGYYTESKARAIFESKYKMALIFRLLILLLKGHYGAWVRVLAKLKSYINTDKHSCRVREHSDSVMRADLLSICVLPYLRGSDIATELINSFERILLNKEIKECTLTVLSDNKRAISFYEKMGYKVYKISTNEIQFIKYY